MTEPDYTHTTGNAATVAEHRAKHEDLCLACRMYKRRLRNYR